MIKHSSRLGLALGMVTIIFALPVSSHQPPSGLLIHLPFEGSVENVGRAHVTPEVISSTVAGSQGSLSYATGYPGQAAVFGGDSAVRIPFDLHPDFYPQLTVTMWIKAGAGLGSGFLFSTGAPSGAKLQFAKGQVTALGPRVQTRVSYTAAADQWILIAGVWDYQAGSVAVFANGEMTALGFNAGVPRNHSFAKPDFWIGTYDDRLGSTNTVSGIHIDEVRIYDRALSQQELIGMAIGPPIEEEPRLGEPLLPPEEESEPHEPPPGIGSEAEPRPGRRDVAPDSSSSGTRPGEDPMLDKLRRTQAPGGHQSDDAVRDVLSDTYEPGPTTDWEQVQKEARKPKVDDEQLERMRESAGSEISAGSDRVDDAVRDAVGADYDPGPTTDWEQVQREASSAPAPDSTAPGEQSESASSSELRTNRQALDPSAASDSPEVTGWRLSRSDSYLSPLAGNTGDVQRVLEPRESSPMTAIYFNERLGAPCRVTITGRSPETGSRAEEAAGTCGGSISVESPPRIAALPVGAYVTGFATDIGGAGNLDKIKLIGYYIDAQGEFGIEVSDAASESGRATASVPHTTRCRPGYLASGARVQFERKGNDTTRVKGLQLICRAIEKISP